MTVKEAIAEEMYKLSLIKNSVFLGENIINSGRIYGTLNQVPIKKCIEMPVAENLIAGAAVGLAISGYIPICIFQRMDFMLIAADAIINHACLLPKISGGIIRLPIIFRTVKASLNKDFFVGYQHSKDLTHVFEPYMPVYQVPKNMKAYTWAVENTKPTLIVEDYSKFGEEV